MTGEWPQQALEEVAELSGGFAFKSEDYSTSGRFVLRTLNINEDGSIHRDDAVFLPLEKCDLYKRFELQEHDTLFVMVGATLGKVGYVRRETLPALLNQNMWRIRGRDGLCDKRYLQYAFRHTVVKNLGWASGSARDFVRRDDYRTMEIPVPPLAEQKTIGKVLGALDDKIELNQRMNATLEAMARALFQSWFVDFEPVRANLDGLRVAGIDKTTAGLFPAHLEDSPLGKVPVGWCVLKFADVLTPHSVRVGEESVPEFSATVTGLSSRDERFKKQLSKSQSKNKRIVAGDLVFGFSREVINFGLMREPVGAVSPVYEVFKIDSSKIEPELLERLFRFNMPYYMDILKPGAREGKPIDREYLLRKHLLVPDIAVQRAFLATIQPWTDKIKANEAESRTLATLRDTLLPKLLSGELQINQ